MVRQVNVWFSPVIALVSIGLAPSEGLSQVGAPTIDEILKVWEDRQQKVANAHFDVSCQETIHKGSSSFKEALVTRKKRTAPLSLPPNPPRDYVVSGTKSVSLSGAKLRYVNDTQKWDPVRKTLYPNRYIDVFDGATYKFLKSPSNEQGYPIAAVRKANASESALRFSIVPIIFMFRGNHEHFFHDLRSFSVADRTVTVSQRPCLELFRAGGSPGSRELFYLDRERNYVVVRKLSVVGESPNWQLDVSYGPDATVGWVPQSWECIIRAGKESQIVESCRCTVTSYDLSATMARDEFDIQLPPKTRVFDETAAKETQYAILETGEKGLEIPTASNPRYEDLHKPRARFSRGSLLTLWIVGFMLTLGTWVWLRWRRMQGVRHSSRSI